MKELNYKGILFDSFCFSNENGDKYGSESNIKTLEDIKGGGWGYICPHCIEKYNLYNEADIKKEELKNIEENRINDDNLSLTCCVKDCYNKNAYAIDFDIKHCKFVEI